MTYIVLTIVILFSTLVTSFINFPFSILIQLVSIITVMTIFFLIIGKRLKPSLKIFQTTIKKVSENDPSLDDSDIRMINSISDHTFFNPKMLIKYANILLLNQNTFLETIRNDRDYINRYKNLQNTVIHLNHYIVSSNNIETLLEEILKTAIITISDSKAGSVMIPDHEGNVKYVAAVNMDLKKLKKTRMNIQDTYIYKLSRGKELKPVIVRNKIKFNENFHTLENNRFIEESGANAYPCALSSPIIIDNIVYGVLSLDSSSADAFDQEDLRMMEYFTSEMAIVIKNSRLIKKAVQLSKFDSLTNVHNRYFFEEIARLAFEEVLRYKGQLHIALFDLDNFKSVNDTYGHSEGDMVLKNFSSVISSSIRGSDVFARFGGDEFIALFRNSNTDNIEKKITAIRKKLEDSPLIFGNTKYRIKFSYGISSFPEGGKTLEDILKTADKNMYKNKELNKMEIPNESDIDLS